MMIKLLNYTKNGEWLIEYAGRTSHNSRQKMSENKEEFIKRLIKMGHFSVLEHASASFHISKVSRALTHQLVRHRIGVAYTQKSQRYTTEENAEFLIPNTIKNTIKNTTTEKMYKDLNKMIKDFYKFMRSLNIPKEDARYILPNSTYTELVMTANLRAWRHILSLRGSKHAQWEIRELSLNILRILKEIFPNVFFDFKVLEKDKYGKIIRVDYKDNG